MSNNISFAYLDDCSNERKQISKPNNKCPRCEATFFTERMSDSIPMSLRDGVHIYGYLYHKYECRLCGYQWHYIPLPPNQLPVKHEEYGYFLDEPDETDTSKWIYHVIHDGKVPTSEKTSIKQTESSKSDDSPVVKQNKYQCCIY